MDTGSPPVKVVQLLKDQNSSTVLLENISAYAGLSLKRGKRDLDPLALGPVPDGGPKLMSLELAKASLSGSQ